MEDAVATNECITQGEKIIIEELVRELFADGKFNEFKYFPGNSTFNSLLYNVCNGETEFEPDEEFVASILTKLYGKGLIENNVAEPTTSSVGGTVSMKFKSFRFTEKGTKIVKAILDRPFMVYSEHSGSDLVVFY